MLKNEYRSWMETVRPSPALEKNIWKAMRRELAHSGRRRSTRRVLILTACIILLTLLSFTVLAAAVPSFRDRLFGPESEVKDYLIPQENLILEEQGFRFEILGAMHDENTVVLYLSAQDVSGKNRLSQETSLQLHNSVNDRDFEAALSGEESQPTFLTGPNGACTCVGYDEESRTILYRYWISGENLKELQITGGEIYLGYRHEPFLPINLDLEKFSGETMDFLSDKEDGAFYFYWNEHEEPVLLKPEAVPLPLDSFSHVSLSAAGEVNGRLRLQIELDPEPYRENRLYGTISLYDGEVLRQEELETQGFLTLEMLHRSQTAEGWGEYDEDPITLSYGSPGANFLAFKRDTETGIPAVFTPEHGPALTAEEEKRREEYGKEYNCMEYAFDIAPEELGRYYLTGDFTYYDAKISLQTALNIPLEDAGSEVRKLGTLAAPEREYENVKVNEFGISVETDWRSADHLDITAEYQGKTIHYTPYLLRKLTGAEEKFGKISCQYLADIPADPMEINSIQINGTRYVLN